MLNNPADGQVGLCDRSSLFCRVLRQRVGEAIAGFRNWGQKNVKTEV